MVRVVKRNGRVETLDVSKIQKYTSAAVEGLDDVSQSELEVDAKLQFRDMITSEEIQTTLIKTAVDKIDIDRPNWTFVAARLFLYDIYHKATGFTGYNHLREYFERGEKEGRIVLGLKDKYDLDDLNDYIKPERDLQFNYLGLRTLYDRYLLKDRNGVPIELPQQLFMGVAMFLAQNEFDCQTWAKKFYDILSKFEVMAATPTLSNARTPRHQLSSCYIGSTPDNIEGIFDGYKEMALLSKFGGGIGWDWTLVRGMGSYIDGHKHAAGGIVPFLKIANDVAIAVDQLGTRKGAIAVYLEPWHVDVRDFLDLKKNSGEERRRAHDLFPALWLNDLFMKRVEEDATWTLFDPFEVTELTELYGEEFEKRYVELEHSDADITREVISAKGLWKEILRSYFETGNPFLTFKDAANRANPNKHVGIIRSSNLCTEIFQNTAPNTYKTRFTFTDGSIESYDENEMLTVDNGTTKPAKKVTALDSLGGKQIWIVDKEKIDGDTAVCNLASINLSKIHTKEDIARVVPTAVRMLDNVIDLNFYPLAKVKRTNEKSRSIGLGVMGEAQMLAENQIAWGSHDHFTKIDEVMESVSYYAIEASSNLALEKGKYPTFDGSDWSKGIFPIDKANENACKLVDRGGLFGYSHDWTALREKVKTDGMRNGYLMAVAPTSSISILTGTTQAIEPVYKRKWFEENLSGLIPVTAPKLSPDTWQYYTPAYDLDQNVLIKAGAIRQKWIDQGQSLNIFITLDKASGKYLNEIYMNAWKFGLKSTYYLRSQSPESSNDVEDRSQECVGCQ
ncbi:ribonucleoside-diphosphate reductase subunit alpha [Sulfurovum sp. NBC37-1]|uniref:ribonucleoside-diphosphate reductase subunit alpha n=1 Tax=Sulfurovum sp. (strain NBC37-1) TaxID=387093 RepID=UPI0001587A70|nr:ribonucleoside-diphosphate reductase subunit alpha [Sulfurovum sp. NBC37-1]BAF73308.1 ribonucleoside-diphosphate reductase, alpha subunit [Sulfurovum sp. NBC37-1]